MNTIKYDEIISKSGKRLTVSTILLPNGDYETMVLYPNGHALEEAHNRDEVVALKAHEKWLHEYAYNPAKPDEGPLTKRYLDLAAALKQAVDAALLLADTDDGGTSNHDSLELTLPGYRERDIMRAVDMAGLGAFKTKLFRATVYIIRPPVSRQGNARTRQAEKMREAMVDAGYQASVWYQMD